MAESKARWRHVVAGDGGRKSHLKALQVMVGTGKVRETFTTGLSPKTSCLIRGMKIPNTLSSFSLNTLAKTQKLER